MSSKNNWNFDPAHSGINFSVRHMVFAKVRGKFTGWSGELQLDPAELTKSRIAVEIDAASIDTGVAERDAHLRSADFLDVERFPKLRFRSTRIETLGENRYRIYGELSMFTSENRPQRILESFPNRGELIIVPGAHHHLMLDRPLQLVEAIQRLLAI